MAVADRGSLPTLLGAQARASTPDEHVWLSASAGTGKTQVLAARVFRLLLRGTDPSAILCLTFTKAGAAEMAGRITARLAAWVRMADADLGCDLKALGELPTPDLRARARTLFAKLLDSPGGGIRISTIHGFCQGLLAGFPVEAGLVPGFRPIEGREEAVLMRETLAELLVDAERDGRLPIIDALDALSLRLGEGGAEDFLHACARAPAALAALPVGFAADLREKLGLPREDIDDYFERACADDAFDVDGVRRLAVANRAWGTNLGNGHADIAECWIAAAPKVRATMLAELATIGFTGSGEPRVYSPKLLATDPDYADIAIRIAARATELAGLAKRAGYADVLARGLDAGRAYADAYARAKRRLGVADFDDLIRSAVDLLEQPGMGDWVRFKLDLATDHILVDEAQDTNPRQWRIVFAIAREFFAGEGAKGDTSRTLFVVGDYKQAIFGFQGTDPVYFDEAEQVFTNLARAARDDETDQGTPFNRLSLTSSFRSTQPILAFVDTAIAHLGPPGLGVEEPPAHVSQVPGPGSVTLWPPMTLDAADVDEEEWVGGATRALAKRIARQIKDWLDPANPLMLESQGRALRPEDVMILVKRRGELAALIVARLYAEGVPVAGVDRLRLNAPLAVRDLLAAIRFALQPDDDLSLASLLVSPLMGWSQDELLSASVPRRDSLWRHLRAHADAERLAPLYDLLARADFATPHQLLEHLLSGPLDGRRKLIGRLGAEARDPIEELVSAALDFESRATPSLQAFLDWFDRGEVEIVRDPSTPLDAVRVMTVHGAKGLQAPLVLLADACVDPGSAPRSLLRWTPDGMEDPLPIFRLRAEERGGPLDNVMAEAAARELKEHWRLFYVAATRAQERLVIAGALGPRAKGVPPTASWYAAADRAFAALGVVADGDGERVFRGDTRLRPVAAKDKEAPGVAADIAVPEWARASAPVEARPPRPLAPSALGDDAVSDPPPTPAMRAAAERGRLIHALLERLPDIDPTARHAAADRWLDSAGGVGDPSDRAAIVADVLRVIEDPQFAALFGPDALAEAPIAAVVADGLVVSGTVDRLLVLPDRIRVVDFKTGRRAPASIESIPTYHLRQMAAYAAALEVIFPDRVVETALLYTAAPVLFVLPPALLAAHKPNFGARDESLPSIA